MVFVDESANSEGYGVGVILMSPQGEKTKLVMRLQFLASNNELEYEALIIGVRAMQNVGATQILKNLDPNQWSNKWKLLSRLRMRSSESIVKLLSIARIISWKCN